MWLFSGNSFQLVMMIMCGVAAAAPAKLRRK
jgi:hypothetical protein